MRRAGYVRNVKNAIINVFGRAFISNFPGHKSTTEEIKEWKTSTNVQWARNNLWNPVKDGDGPSDTYINRITKEVLTSERRTLNNCAFVIAVVDLILDPNVQTTTLTGEAIATRIEENSNNYEEVQWLISY